MKILRFCFYYHQPSLSVSSPPLEHLVITREAYAGRVVIFVCFTWASIESLMFFSIVSFDGVLYKITDRPY